MTPPPIFKAGGVCVIAPRELDVLSAAARGLGVVATAAVMGVKPETVKSTRRHILRKMRAPTLTVACLWAKDAGVLC